MFSRQSALSFPHTRNGKPLQAKLDIAPVHDPLEREADRIAADVLRQPDPRRDSQPTARSRSAASAAGSGGRPLDASLREYFEPRFGFDFSQVRVHADDAAAESARSMGALAYTSGPEISFDSGLFQPASGEGRRLLAHELTHVVQQGQAAPLPGASGVRASRTAAPMIQRDTPKTTPGPLLPVANPQTMASRTEVTEALTTFLYKVQEKQGGQTLHVDEAVKLAVRKIFVEDPVRSASAEAFLNGITPSDPPEFAAAVAKMLPAAIPRARIAHLATQSPTFSEDTRPKSLGDAVGKVVTDATLKPILKEATKTSTFSFLKDKQKDILEGARGGVGDALAALAGPATSNAPMSDAAKSAIKSTWEGVVKYEGKPMDRQDPGPGSPYAQPQLPDVNFPESPGQHIIKSPTIKWDIPTNDPIKPNLPKPPLASEASAVDKIIQGIDDNSLRPASVQAAIKDAEASKDKQKISEAQDAAGSYINAKDLARSVANMLADANKKKQYSVDLTIPMGYRRQPDLREIFDKIEAIVRQIAAAVPGGVPNVGQVIITPAKDANDQTFPMRRIVNLNSSS